MNLQEFRSEYPQYDSVPDDQLVERLHQKYYSSISKEEFAERIGYSEPKKEPGYLKSFGRGLAEGVTTELPGMVGAGAEFIGSKLGLGGLESTGKGIKEWSEEKAEEWFGPPPENLPWLKSVVYEGSKMLGPSIIPGGGAATGARAVLGVGKLVKAAKVAKTAAEATNLIAKANKIAKISNDIGAASAGVLFGLSQAQNTIDSANLTAAELEKQGDIEGAARVRATAQGAAPYITGAIEAVGEFFGTRYLGKLLGLSEAEIAKRAPKEIIVDLLRTLGVEIGTEVGQQTGQAAVEKVTGIRPDADILNEALSVIGPTAFMTLLTGGLAGGMQAVGAKQQQDTAEEPPPPAKEEPPSPEAQDAIINEILEGADPEKVFEKYMPGSGGTVEDVAPATRKEAKPAPSRVVEGEPTPDMGPTNLQRLRGQVRGKDWRYVDDRGGLIEDIPAPVAEEAVVKESLTAEPVEEPAPPAKEAKEEVAAKEPWEMTKDEYFTEIEHPRFAELSRLRQEYAQSWSSLGAEMATEKARKRVKSQFDKAEKEFKEIAEGQKHKKLIKQAISEGKPVPAEVLKDYPDLAKKEAPTPQEEPIISEAAIKLKDGTVLRGRTHADIYDRMDANQQRDIEESDGFWVQDKFDAIGKTGRYISRDDAQKLVGKPLDATDSKGVVVKAPQPKEAVAPPKQAKEAVKQTPGRAWIKDSWRPFTSFREITKGKNKGWVQVTVAGKKHTITKDKVSKWPGEAEVKATEAPVEVKETKTGPKVSVDIPKSEAKKLTTKEQKAYLLAEIDKAIEQAPETATEEAGPWVVIEIPGDGKFSIGNDKKSLTVFRKAAQSKWKLGKPSSIITGFPVKDIEGQVKQAIELYGDAAKAAKTINKQIEQFEDLTDTERVRLDALVDTLEARANEFKDGDVITDGLVNGRVIGRGKVMSRKGFIDAYRIEILSGRQKGDTSLIPIDQAKAKPTEPKAELAPPTPTGLSVQALAGIQEKLRKRFKLLDGLLYPLEDTADLPKQAKDRFRNQLDGLRGVLVRGAEGTVRIYQISNNLASEKEATLNAIHEGSHYGVSLILPPEQYKKFMKGVYFAKQKAVDALAEDYGYDVKTEQGRLMAADEWFARQVSEKDMQPGSWLKKQFDRLVKMINDALRAMGLDITLSDAEIRIMQRAVAKRIVQGPAGAVQVSSVSAELGRTEKDTVTLKQPDGTTAKFPTLVNPSESRLRGLLNRSKEKEIRAMIGPDGNVYAWDATLATHADVADFYGFRYQDARMYQVPEWDFDTKVAEIRGLVEPQADIQADLGPGKEEAFTKEHDADTLGVFESLLDFVKANKRGWKEQRPDTHWLDRLASLPSHHFKKVPALFEMFKDGLRRTDDYHTLQESLLKRTDGQYSPNVLKDLSKKDKAEFKRVNDYLLHRDRNAIGHTVTYNKEADTYTVFFNKQDMGTFQSEEQAWSAARNDELERMAKAGFSKEAIESVAGFRFTTDNGFKVLMKNIRDIITKFEGLGLPLPTVTVRTDDGSVKVDLRVALSQMGDIRGYYFPRIRRAGQYMLVAEKQNANPILEFYDQKGKLNPFAAINRRQVELENKGYKVTKDLSPKMPEDVFQMAGETVAMQATINQALEKMKSQGISLDDFGIEGEYKGNDFLVKGPTTKKMNKVLKDKLGGRFYQSKFDEKEVWHFVNPGKQFEKRLTTALAEEIDVIGQNMDVLFAKTLAEQVANVIKARGHRAHMIKRKQAVGKDVWLGYEEDSSLALAQYAKGIAAGEAKKNMALNMVRHFTGTDVSWQQFKEMQSEKGEEATYEDYRDFVEEKRIHPTKQPNAFREAKVFMEDMLRNQEHIDRLMGTIKGIAVLKYLGFRVAAPVVNLTALPTSATAAISGYTKAGIGKSMASIVKAGNHYINYKFRQKAVPEDIKTLFEEIESKGWHKAQYNREALSVLETQVGKHWRTFMEWSMAMFGATEQFNRAATIGGAYLAIKNTTPANRFDHDKALQKAKDISDKAHAIYDKTNIPHWARGSGLAGQVFQTFYIFKRFSHNYLLTMYDLGMRKHEAKAALYMAVAPAILGGAGALVGKEIITTLFKALGLGGDDPEEEFYAWMYENAGERGERLARFGMFGALGVSLKGSLEIGITDIPTSITEVLGAPGSMFADLYYSGKDFARGDVVKGIEKMSPNFMGSMFRAYREGSEGLTTRSNAPVFYGRERAVADTVDSIIRFMSFNPAQVAKIKEKQWKERNIESQYSKMRTDLYAKFKRYYLQPPEKRKKSDYIDLLTEIKEYNARVKERGLHRKGIPFITSDSLKNNLKQAFRPSKKERLRAANE